MARRYLFGPVPPAYAEQKLKRQREAGACLLFNHEGNVDLTIAAGDDWGTVQSRFPSGWQPDFVVLNLSYTCIPSCLWNAPLPLVGLAPDWNLQWHAYRRRLRQCELIFTDTVGVETLAQEGITHAQSVNLFGCDRVYVEGAWPQVPRDIDTLFLGNFNTSVQRERLPWLARLSKLAERRRVVLAGGVFGEGYRGLLRRARIVFNRGIRGECNMRVFEAIAAGALLFQEEGNREVLSYFQAGKEYVEYNADNLEKLLEHYLEHEDEREAIAEAARTKIGQFTYEKFWDQHVTLIESRWSELQEGCRKRLIPSPTEDLLTRTWQVLNSSLGEDPTLFRDLRAALEAEPRSAALHNALGLVVSKINQRGERFSSNLAEAASIHFRAALDCDPQHVVAGLNLTEALVGMQQKQAAIEQAHRTLGVLDQQKELSAADLDGAHFPPLFDVFRVEWERAAWLNAGQTQEEARAKQSLLRWRLHTILAELTGELDHYKAACAARCDLPISQAVLGCALGRAGRSREAVSPLREALAGNPFDNGVARALCQALIDMGDRDGQAKLAQDRRLLARAAPGLVAREPWFAEESAPTTAPPSPAAAPSRNGHPSRVQAVSLDELRRRFGTVDTSRALINYTNAQDTNIILTLLVHSRAERLLEVGTALGHMTANFTEWTHEKAAVFTLGTTAEWHVPTPALQLHETPDRGACGSMANHFLKASKVFFITADSLTYDFSRLPLLDFVFIDGAHDLPHVVSDTLKAYSVLKPGGFLVWHDYGSQAEWVEVQEALNRIVFLEPLYHVSGTGVAFLRTAEVNSPPVLHPPRVSIPVESGSPLLQAGESVKGCIVWEGVQRAMHSFGLLNREICRQLVQRGHEVSILPSDYPGVIERVAGKTAPPGYKEIEPDNVPIEPTMLECFLRPPSRPVDIHVRTQWPPQLTPPPSGHWVIQQPWEFGSIPKLWLGPMTNEVDEVWACSNYVRDCFVASGVPAEQVQVIPLGVDCERFHPEVTPLRLKSQKKFKFLFVGGTIHRKGIDILLHAYAQAFTNDDNVCLVVKDMGVATFYRGQTAEARIADLRQRPEAPEIEYLDEKLTDEQLAGLYAACDCLVHSYRGEGFGLPIAEAMACGLPVIVTGFGAALDFCNTENAYLIPTRISYLSERRVGDLETVDYPWECAPDPAALVNLLRHVKANPEEAKGKGQLGREQIRSRFSWAQAAQAVEQRLIALKNKPIRRLGGKTVTSVERNGSTGAARTHSTVSLCMIVKNEEKNLPACLESVADLVDEIVVVDTGSTDRTKEVAARFGATIADFPWVDDFSAARNECLRHASGDWIFWLDADDRIDAVNRQKLKTLFASLKDEIAGLTMKCLCLPDPKSGATTIVDHVWLFRNRPGLRWEYRVHEQILPALRWLNAVIRWADVIIHHVGYQDPALQGRKAERNLRLLKMNQGEKPDDPFILFNLGLTYQEMGKTYEAVPLLQRSLERSHPSDSIVRKLYAALSQCHRELGQKELALAACKKGREFYPDDIELLFNEGLARRDLGDRQSAEKCWLELLKPRSAEHFASIDPGLSTYRARHNLAFLYQEEKRFTEAEQQWRQALAVQPGFVPAWLGLGDLFLAQGRWLELEECARLLAPGVAIEATALRARGCLARKEPTEARRLLEEAIAQFPQASLLRRILTYALLQEGKDWAAAEKALRDLLALDPNDSEARNNLSVLLRQRGGSADAGRKKKG